jgi:hypothetical protein
VQAMIYLRRRYCGKYKCTSAEHIIAKIHS